MDIKSKKGSGTTVRIVLPRKRLDMILDETRNKE